MVHQWHQLISLNIIGNGTDIHIRCRIFRNLNFGAPLRIRNNNNRSKNNYSTAVMQKHVAKEKRTVTFYVLETHDAAIWEMFSLFVCLLIRFNIFLEFGSAGYVMVDWAILLRMLKSQYSNALVRVLCV